MNAVLQLTDCFHCGLPVPPGSSWSVTIDELERAMCCPGCEAVAQTIVDIGQSKYYTERDDYAANAFDATLMPPELRLYSNDDAQFARDASSCEATLSVEGIRCAACVWLIERQLSRLPGVQAASLNVATERLYVRWSKAQCEPGDILQAVRQVGYTAYPYDAVRHGEQLQKASKTLGRQLFVAGLSMMQVMMYVAPSYLAAEDGTLDPDMASLMRWASLMLTLPAICYSALPFFQGAWSSLRARTLGMDVPVTLGILAAFFGSLVATFTGQGEVYFDSATMFIFLLLCSRYFELQARRKAASALERLQHALPASATLLPGFPDSRATALVPAGSLAVGDVILVKPGEAVAADSVIIEGNSALDLSLLTGESAAQREKHRRTGARRRHQRQRGAAAAGLETGARKHPVRPAETDRAGRQRQAADRAVGRQGGRLVRAGPAAVCRRRVRLLELARPVAGLAGGDRRAGGVVPVRAVAGHADRAGGRHRQPAAARRADRPAACARNPAPRHPYRVRQDRHTDPGPAGAAADRQPGQLDEQTCLHVAAALETGSAHPLAQAILEAAGAAEPGACAAAAGSAGPGPGRDRRRRALPARQCGLCCGDRRPALGDTALGVDGMTPLYLGTQGQWLARFLLSDALRPEAREVVEYFQRHGKQVVLLSGDQEALTQGVARELGIATACGECLPDEKLDFVQQLQATGAVVAMVGDGINDAAVLSAADVSFAMGSGAALAQAHADTVLLSSQLRSVLDTASTAARSMRIIRENLGWATLYNLTAIPAAALGFLNPWLSGVGMAASSAVVIANALRLRKT